MAWHTVAQHANAALLVQFGAPVMLPSGDIVTGIFEPVGRPAPSPVSPVGLVARVDQRPNPRVLVRDAQAEDLQINDVVRIEGADYQVTAPPRPDGSGLTPVELRPLAEDEQPHAGRWR